MKSSAKSTRLTIKVKLQRARQYVKDLKDDTKRVSQSKIQQLTQFIRRHRQWFIVGTAVVTGVLLTAISTYLYRRRYLTQTEIKLRKVVEGLNSNITSAKSETKPETKSETKPETESTKSNDVVNDNTLNTTNNVLNQIKRSVKNANVAASNVVAPPPPPSKFLDVFKVKSKQEKFEDNIDKYRTSLADSMTNYILIVRYAECPKIRERVIRRMKISDEDKKMLISQISKYCSYEHYQTRFDIEVNYKSEFMLDGQTIVGEYTFRSFSKLDKMYQRIRKEYDMLDTLKKSSYTLIEHTYGIPTLYKYITFSKLLKDIQTSSSFPWNRHMIIHNIVVDEEDKKNPKSQIKKTRNEPAGEKAFIIGRDRQIKKTFKNLYRRSPTQDELQHRVLHTKLTKGILDKWREKYIKQLDKEISKLW